jgi:hypothetical protein
MLDIVPFAGQGEEGLKTNRASGNDVQTDIQLIFTVRKKHLPGILPEKNKVTADLERR